MQKKQFTIISEVGLHARPATLLVQHASRFSCEVDIDYKGKQVNVKSIMGVMSLGMPKNAEFTVITDGHDEEEAIESITKLFTDEGIAE